MSARIKVVLTYAVLNDGLLSKSEKKKGIDKILSLGFQETCLCECMVTRLNAHNCTAGNLLVTKKSLKEHNKTLVLMRGHCSKLRHNISDHTGVGKELRRVTKMVLSGHKEHLYGVQSTTNILKRQYG